MTTSNELFFNTLIVSYNWISYYNSVYVTIFVQMFVFHGYVQIVPYAISHPPEYISAMLKNQQ